jgi:peptidoglycan/xylan/chitin deacetylase (PgdA/CDA1 family)
MQGMRRTRSWQVGAVALAATAAWTGPAATNLALRRGHRWSYRRLEDRSTVALTFDDGPQPGATEAVLDVLAELDVRATFFVVGEHAREHPHIVRDILEGGHVVQCHGQRHANHLLRNPLGIDADMQRSRDVIESLTGTRPVLFRPPQGVVTWPTLAASARWFDATVLWSRWGRDWRHQATPQSIADEVSLGVRGGDILLLHDADWYGTGSVQHTATAVRTVVQRVRALDLELVTLEDATRLAGRTAPLHPARSPERPAMAGSHAMKDLR